MSRPATSHLFRIMTIPSHPLTKYMYWLQTLNLSLVLLEVSILYKSLFTTKYFPVMSPVYRLSPDFVKGCCVGFLALHTSLAHSLHISGHARPHTVGLNVLQGGVPRTMPNLLMSLFYDHWPFILWQHKSGVCMCTHKWWYQGEQFLFNVSIFHSFNVILGHFPLFIESNLLFLISMTCG